MKDFTPKELIGRIKAQLGVRSSATNKPSQPSETGDTVFCKLCNLNICKTRLEHHGSGATRKTTELGDKKH